MRGREGGGGSIKDGKDIIDQYWEEGRENKNTIE
jgi:hypothetical protein